MPAFGMVIPITKVDTAQRLVYGLATAEIKDRSGEICDYETTKPYYEKWSDDISKSSGGKSLGNVRAMHGAVAAGKVTALSFNDAEKQIEICAKVVDDDEWNKVEEGVYTGFSQGGTYVRRWTGDDGEARYTAAPSEISLVDLPCLPQASFEMIKADGSSEWRPFAPLQGADADESGIDASQAQALHDKAVELGATCRSPPLKATQPLDLQKRFDTLAISLDDILTRLKKIEAQPLPMPISGRVRVVSKQDDGYGEKDESALLEKLLDDPQTLSLLAIKLAQKRGRSA